jgi:hypothetical protein
MSGIRRLLRTIRRDPGTSAMAVLSITIGIGLNAVVFSIVDWVWLQPSPCSDWR